MRFHEVCLCDQKDTNLGQMRITNGGVLCIRFAIHSTTCQLLPPANEVWGKVMFLQLSVILFTVEEYLGRYPLGRYTPQQVQYLGKYTPWQVPPGRHTPWQVHPQAGTPPSRYTPLAMHAGIQSTSGRYASYWNAFLFFNSFTFFTPLA